MRPVHNETCKSYLSSNGGLASGGREDLCEPGGDREVKPLIEDRECGNAGGPGCSYRLLAFVNSGDRCQVCPSPRCSAVLKLLTKWFWLGLFLRGHHRLD
jgi:hypothetical protein